MKERRNSERSIKETIEYRRKRVSFLLSLKLSWKLNCPDQIMSLSTNSRTNSHSFYGVGGGYV